MALLAASLSCMEPRKCGISAAGSGGSCAQEAAAAKAAQSSCAQEAAARCGRSACPVAGLALVLAACGARHASTAAATTDPAR